MRRGIFLLGLVMVACTPVYALAAVTIMEITYDPAGADTKHEWIEVMNDGAPVDLSLWKLFEGGSNHGLEVYAGSATLSSGGYAIIADDPATFLVDYPGFSGTLFNTALSSGLNNTNGEMLTLRDEALVDRDSITYNPALGAAGDGNSLQKIMGAWQSAAPTPGAAGVAGTSAPTPPGTTAGSSTTLPQSNADDPPAEPKITAEAGNDRTVVAGATTVFSAVVAGLTGELIGNARFLWSFGNGETREGHSVLYTFPIPGTYVVTVDASSGFLSDADRITVTVVPAQVSIGRITTDFIEITNGATAELDLGLWQLSAGEKTFVFPLNTVVLPHQSVAVSNKVTGLLPVGAEGVMLLYPNGAPAATGSYREPLFITAPNKETTVVAAAKVGPESKPEPPPESSLIAAAVASSPPTPSNVWWYLALIALIVVGCAVVYFLQKKTNDS